MVKTDDFDFDIELSICLVEPRPVLWNKMGDIYKDWNETKKARTEVCVCLQKGFEASGDVKKTLVINIATSY